MGYLNLNLCILATAFATIISFWSFDKVPTAWIFDYGLTKEKIRDGNLYLFSKKKKIKAAIFTMGYFFTIFTLFFDGSFAVLLVKYLILFVLAHIGISDMLNQIIPDQHVVLIGICGILFRCIPLDEGMVDSLTKGMIGGILGFALYFVPYVIAYLITKKEIVGFGDIKLFAVLGIVIGAERVLILFVFTNILSFIVSIIMLVCEYLNNDLKIKKTRKSCIFQGYVTLPLAPIINILFIFCIYY